MSAKSASPTATGARVVSGADVVLSSMGNVESVPRVGGADVLPLAPRVPNKRSSSKYRPLIALLLPVVLTNTSVVAALSVVVMGKAVVEYEMFTNSVVGGMVVFKRAGLTVSMSKFR